jgi:hypothetical protein
LKPQGRRLRHLQLVIQKVEIVPRHFIPIPYDRLQGFLLIAHRSRCRRCRSCIGMLEERHQKRSLRLQSHKRFLTLPTYLALTKRRTRNSRLS